MERLGQVGLEQAGDELLKNTEDEGFLDQVEIVEDQHEAPRMIEDIAGKGVRDNACGRDQPRKQHGLDLAQGREILAAAPFQRFDQVGEEASGVVIVGVDGQPRDRQLQRGEPLADASGFAKAGRGRDERHGPVQLQALVHAADERRARDMLERRLGPVEFDREKISHDGLLYHVL